MADLREAFEALALRTVEHLPVRDVRTGAEAWKRTLRYLRIYDPLTRQIKESSHFRNDEPSVDAVAGFLIQALRINDESLKVTLLDPRDVDCLPEMMARYHEFYSHLVKDETGRLMEQAEEELGLVGLMNFERQFWEEIGIQMVDFLQDEYRTFFDQSSHGLIANTIEGFTDTVMCFLLAAVLNDTASVRLLAPMVRQLTECLPVGSLTSDPLHWYVVMPDLFTTRDEDDGPFSPEDV